jgi:hypothetical protein
MMGSFQLIEMKWVPDAERIWVRRSVLEGGGCVECFEEERARARSEFSFIVSAQRANRLEARN